MSDYQYIKDYCTVLTTVGHQKSEKICEICNVLKKELKINLDKTEYQTASQESINHIEIKEGTEKIGHKN